MNYQDYLLGLLNGSQSVSNECIGMVLERLDKLENIAAIANQYIVAIWHGNEVSQADKLEELDDALSALEDTK